MHILVVAATTQELPPLSADRPAHTIDSLVAGIGMVPTAARVAQALTRNRYDLALNFGLCGAFDRTFPLGTVVHVVRDCLSEVMVEDDERLVPFSDFGLAVDTVIVNEQPPDNSALRELPAVNGITVNTVHGSDKSIAAIRARLQPQVETMEGAAFAVACRTCDVPYAQIRAVSNVVERRDRDAWRIDLALTALKAAARRVLDAA